MKEANPETKPREFRVPLGLDAEGTLTPPDVAEQGAAYRCPGCDSRLVLRKGRKVRHHFAHKGTTTCSGESALHHAAKFLIAERIGNGAPVFVLKCDDCREPFEVPFPRDRALAASLEYRLPSGRVVDIALLENGTAVLAVEVFVSSAVDVKKAGDLSIPWIELAAEEVVALPDVWRASRLLKNAGNHTSSGLENPERS